MNKFMRNIAYAKEVYYTEYSNLFHETCTDVDDDLSIIVDGMLGICLV